MKFLTFAFVINNHLDQKRANSDFPSGIFCVPNTVDNDVMYLTRA